MNHIKKTVSAMTDFGKEMHPVSQVCYHQRLQSYKLGNHSHKFYQLIYITDGSLTVYADKKYDCPEGTVIILPPGVHHSLESVSGYAQMGIDFEFCTDPQNPHHALASSQSVYKSSAPRFLDMAKDISKWIDSFSIHSDIILKNYVNLFLLLVANRQSNHQSAHFGTRLSEYLDQNLDKEISIDDIATALTISSSHLQRLCHQYFGTGVKNLFNKKRYSRACALLTDTSLSAKEIGEIIGFSTAANFSAFFKKHAGVTPLTYRKNNFM